MKKEAKDKLCNILTMIEEDMEKDVKFYDGQDFNGRNVAAYMGKHGAAIAALANIIKAHITED